MADVGRLAGVSPTTVSFVLNPSSNQTISAATRARVLQAVNDLDYRPNRAAQGLRGKRSGVIGTVVDETPMESFVGVAVCGMHDVVWSAGRVLLTTHTNRRPNILQAAADELIDRQVDGLAFLVSGTRQLLPPRTTTTPLSVLVNCYDETSSWPTILPDDEAGGAAAVRQLIDAGHTRIAFLTGHSGAWATSRRLAGHRRAVREAGLHPADQVELTGNYYLDSGYELTRRVVTDHPGVTGLVCGNDRMAVGAYLALAEAGLRIPQDMSVVGYDDNEPTVVQLTPRLSTVRLPLYDMGRLAGRMLVDAEAHPARTTYMRCEPVPRDSVAAPRA